MDPISRSVCVHVSSQERGEAEFRFADAELRFDGGALFVHADRDEKILLMAFAPGTWKAAWRVDSATGRPLGLSEAQASHGAQAPREPATSKSMSEPLAVKTPDQELAAIRQARLQKISEALATIPYDGLAAFSKAIGEPEREVENALSAGISNGAIAPEMVAVARIQQELAMCMPAILAEHPKKISEILQHAKQPERSPECDYVQLRVWLKQNPQNR